MSEAIPLAILLAAGLVLLWSAACFAEALVLLRPPRRTYASAVAKGKPGTPAELPTPRAFHASTLDHPSALPLWDIDGDRHADPAAPTVILVHGWGDSRVGALSRLPACLPSAARVIAIDLPAHGDAPRRSPFTLGVREHQPVLALLDQLHAAEPTRPIVLFGWSLGAGVCLAAAAERPARVAAVIAESPYRLPWTPARNVLRYYGLPHRATLMPIMRFLGTRFGVGPAWRGFDRAHIASRLAAPLLVVHGVEDAVCPVADGRDIAAAAPDGSIAEFESKGHNDLWSGPSTPAESIAAFLARALTAPGTAAAPPPA